MDEARVTVRELRNRGGDVLAQVQTGKSFVVTSNGVPVAELRPLTRPPLSTQELLARRVGRPAVDASVLRAEIDAVIDTSL